MVKQTVNVPQNQLPTRHTLNIYFIFSIVLCILVGISSFSGVFYNSIVFPTEELRQGFMATDIINLILIIPLLISAMVLTSFKTSDFIIISIMTIIFSIPFVLFVRGILKSKGDVQT